MCVPRPSGHVVPPLQQHLANLHAWYEHPVCRRFLNEAGNRILELVACVASDLLPKEDVGVA